MTGLRKKKFNLIFLLVILLSVTVGFALLSTTLFIKGSSGIKGGSWNIHWNSNSVVVSNGSVSGEDPIVDGDNDNTVTFVANLELPGDFYEFTVDAINEGSINGEIKSISNLVYDAAGENEVTLPDYIKYSVTYGDDTEPLEGDVLAVGQSKKYKVRVEFDEEATTVPSVDEVYTYKFSVNYQQTKKSGDDPVPPTPTYICKRATSLHTDTCGTNGSCLSSGYSNGATITFGKVSTGTFAYGNAYDCKVEKTGDYTERFYYIGSNGNNAVLIYYTNFEGNDIGLTQSYYYDPAVTKLPKAEKWDNIDVKFGSNDEYAARFIYPSEMEAACDVTISDSSTSTAVNPNKCLYIFENSRFVNESTGRTGMWLEYTDGKYRRLHTKNKAVEIKTTSSENYVRPVIEVDASKINNNIDPSELATITFNVQGGEAIEAISVMKNMPIGELPTPVKDFHVFDGWYTDTTYTTEVTSSTVVTNDMVIVAKWSEFDGVAVVNGTTYNTLAAALNAVDTSDKTTITLLKDIPNESVSVGSSKNIVLDLNGHTLSITSTGSTNVVKNSGTLEIKNGTITSPGGSGAIDNNGGTLLINGVTVNMTGTRQAVYNKGGTLTIDGGSVLSTTSNSQRATVQNLNDGSKIGTTKILDATITSLSNTSTLVNNSGVYVESGVVTLGEKDGVAGDSPVLTGETYGISVGTNGTFNFYDGIIKGKTHAISDENKMAGREEGSTLLTEQDGAYEKATLALETNKYKITFNPNDGEVTPTYKNIDAGNAIGELPVPTKGVYTFDGWYTGLTDGTLVTEQTIPEGSVTYYAHWHYEASNQVVSFDITNDTIKDYYTGIGTWKDDQSTFQTNMDNNFNSYNCSACTGPRYQDCPAPAANKSLCDQAKGYSTGVSDSINVYLSDETTKEKGNLVTYTTSDNGIIYNMIPGVTYYWESANDSNIHGLVKATGNRRFITTSVRNVRDLGGLEVDTDNDGTVDGTLKYGRLFRGAKLSSSNTDVVNLEKLGITEELDLRGSSEGAGDARFSNFQPREITNYLINPTTHNTNYTVFRQALVDTMLDVIANQNIYFHCKIGTDRTGTMAYFLEGLLGVSEEDRVQDYELSYFYGLLNRHRFHDQLDGSSINPRFTTMHNTYDTNQKIYEWFTYGLTGDDKTAADNLINDFRTAMVNYN